MKFSAAAVVVLLALSARHQADAFGVSKLPFGAKLASFPTALNAEGTKITMPALSSTMKEGRVVSWLKNEGDEIEAGEPIMVVESDKADMDVEAFEDGYLAKIIVGEGEMAPVGEAVALIAASEGEISSVVASFDTDSVAAGLIKDTPEPAGSTEAPPAGT
jgi:pyruvate dehydrogenase E2 component (dihydrolipoamide acetyltransferase)